MIKIVSLYSTLSVFEEAIKSKLTTSGFEQNIKLSLKLDTEIVTLTWQNKKLKIVPGVQTKTEIVLDSCSAVRTIFNCSSFDHEIEQPNLSLNEKKFIKTIFPLDLFLPRADYV